MSDSIITSKLKFDTEKGKDHRLPCNRCSVYTVHKVLSSVSEAGDEAIPKYRVSIISWWGDYEIIQCQGCEAISFRQKEGDSENMDYDSAGGVEPEWRVELFPARTGGRRKLEDQRLLPSKIKKIYTETYLAMCNNMGVLAAIGIRTIVEAVCQERGAKAANLAQRIDKLVDVGVLTSDGAKILHGTRFLGNDAAHEVIVPESDKMSAAMDVAEHLLRSVYILPEKATRLSKTKKP